MSAQMQEFMGTLGFKYDMGNWNSKRQYWKYIQSIRMNDEATDIITLDYCCRATLCG